ncbi:MAG: tRNA lysidine(34) synthetase TilS [Clostridiales bacterium]|nr:tRNA lysidine(34) synthetase TilS [Clostridiales bacterium]
MITPGQKILVAVSGGPDSMALMHILYRLADQLDIKLHVFHLNHLFRGEESAKDARVVEDTAKLLGIPSTIKEYNVQKYCNNQGKSKQEGAREIRYQLISHVCARVGASRVAQGHHGDDQVETIFINFLRGSGLTGLKGFLPVRENFYIRPMIYLRRHDIEDYCLRHDINYRIDLSNKKPVYTRNCLRLDIIPRLEDYNPSLASTLLRSAEVLREEDEFLNNETDKVILNAVSFSQKDFFKVNIDILRSQPLALQRRVLRKLWSTLIDDYAGPGFEHVETMLELLQKKKGSWETHLPKGVRVYREYNYLLFNKNHKKDLEEVAPYSYELEVPGCVFIPELGVFVKSRLLSSAQVNDPESLTREEAVLDYDKISSKLYVRGKYPGDYFIPIGLDGAKIKLKKFFIDQKIPWHKRNKIPLVVSDNEIIWVAGIRPAENYKLTRNTERILYLWIEKS